LNFGELGGKLFSEAFPEKQKLWNKERENFIETLKKYNVEVLRPRKLTEKEKNEEIGISNFFVRDPFFTIGNFIIEGSLRARYRRNEVLTVREILLEEAKNPNTTYISTPSVDNSKGVTSEEGPFLEGGDVLVSGKHILVGNSGLASNEKGYLWLKNLLSDFNYSVEQVELASDVLHLDCALSIVKDGLIIVSEESLINNIPNIFKDWDKIFVPHKDVKYLGINGLSISDSVYITDIAVKDTIGRQLEDHGIKVEYLDFKISRSLGGGFRCSSQVLLRREKSNQQHYRFLLKGITTMSYLIR